MLSISKTQEILKQFFGECVEFWKKEGKSEQEAYALALKDVESTTYDPYSPQGEELDTQTKEIFVHYKKIN